MSYFKASQASTFLYRATLVSLISAFPSSSSFRICSTIVRQRLNYRYAEGDIIWDDKATLQYPLICIVAGLCAGMFGIGGGIVQVPLMLHLGVNPKVASASSATMILFTSFTALTSFYVFGLLKMDCAYQPFPPREIDKKNYPPFHSFPS